MELSQGFKATLYESILSETVEDLLPLALLRSLCNFADFFFLAVSVIQLKMSFPSAQHSFSFSMSSCFPFAIAFSSRACLSSQNLLSCCWSSQLHFSTLACTIHGLGGFVKSYSGNTATCINVIFVYIQAFDKGSLISVSSCRSCCSDNFIHHMVSLWKHFSVLGYAWEPFNLLVHHILLQ